MRPTPSPVAPSWVELCAAPLVLTLITRLSLVLWALTGHPSVRPETLFWTADTRRYLELAGSLLGGRFSTVSGPEIYRLPAYPLLLSPGVAMGWPTAYALVAQTLLCCALVVMVVRMAGLLGLEDRAASAAGFLCAVEPTLLLWSVQVMADTLLATFVAAGLWALLAHLRSRAVAPLVVATVMAAGAALVKPVAYGLVVVVAPIAVLAARPQGLRVALRNLLIVSLGAGSVLGAWHARNWLVAGFPGFSTQFSQANRNADYLAWRLGHPEASPAEARAERRRRSIADPTLTGQPLRMESPLPARIRSQLIGSFRTVSNPGVVTWLQFLDLEPSGMKASMELVQRGPSAFFLTSLSDRPRVAAGAVLLGAINVGFWALFLTGASKMIRRRPWEVGAIVLLIAYFIAASGGPWGQSRLRVPFVSGLCLIAGAVFERGPRRGLPPP